jgi:DNA-binding MarR family transcriptional regulator
MSGAQRARLAVAGSDRKLGLLQREIGDRAESEKLDLGHLDQHLGYFVRRLQVMIFRDFIRTLAPMTLRPAQYSVLLLIEANPGSSQAAIGRALGIERARLARLLHDLQGRGWIERRAVNGDARSHALFLRAEGSRALARSKKLAVRHEQQLAKFLGAKRWQSLMELMRSFG